jgi:hypothetical protein
LRPEAIRDHRLEATIRAPAEPSIQVIGASWIA